MATESDLHIVTGALGYSGKYIARALLKQGRRVRTLTGRPDRLSTFGERVEVKPFCFDRPEALTASLRGAAVLYNTYWIRFSHGGVDFEQAIRNSETLIRAAAQARVQRFVHISITNPSEDSPLPYFRGKAIVERMLRESGLSYAILRPTVLFGKEDILINNIAWLLRVLPVFGIPGSGAYHIQPVYVGDLAELAVEQGQERDDIVIDAVGPETYSFEELVRKIREAIGSWAPLIHLPPGLFLWFAGLAGRVLGDVVITPDELAGLADNLLVSTKRPPCPTRFSVWVQQHKDELGRRYSSELKRHYRSL